MSKLPSKPLAEVIYVIFGFVVGAIVGYQVSLQTIPPTTASPYYWLIFGLGGGLCGYMFAVMP